MSTGRNPVYHASTTSGIHHPKRMVRLPANATDFLSGLLEHVALDSRLLRQGFSAADQDPVLASCGRFAKG